MEYAVGQGDASREKKNRFSRVEEELTDEVEC